MGSYLSRNSGEVQELDITSNTTYRYPPKTGNYFASHFIMGGQKFETMQPENYLFGENNDLNFLGPKPQNVPYRVSSPSQPIRALRCYVNIRKDSLRLVKVPCASNKPVTNEETNPEHGRQISTEEGEGSFLYNIEFTFDADCPCSITIYYNATEEIFNKNVIYSPDPARDCSDTVHFNIGCNQQFCIPTHCVDPAKLAITPVDWTKGYTKIPIVIQVCADCGPTIVGHSHITYAEFYQPSDGNWSVRTVKQKQAIDGVCYLIQEIFGIENKATNEDDEDDDNESEDDGSDCVVCLSETRDTLILPCKHLCLCSACANQLRYQQSGCPICRQSFRALLQIRAVRKKDPNSDPAKARNLRQRTDTDSNAEENEEDHVEIVLPVPQGYEVVPLIEAIRGNHKSTPKERTVPDKVTPVASMDEITLVDETGALPSTSGSLHSRHILTEEITIASDSSDEDTEVTYEVKNEGTSLTVTTEPEHTDEEDDDDDDDNGNPIEEHLYHDIILPEEDDDDDDDNGNPIEEHLYHDIILPGVTDSEAGAESTESQKSTNELLKESDQQNDDVVEVFMEKSAHHDITEPVEV